MYIIDSKKIDLTEDEYRVYENICRSYDRPNFKGESLFKNLFETDNDGIILFIRPPATFTSLEVVVFMMACQQQQHIRLMYGQLESFISDTESKIEQSLNKELKTLNDRILALEQKFGDKA
jgi:hypothetical protein